MDNMDNGTPRMPNPRRKRRTPMQIFVKTYLPFLIVVVLIILFIVFAVGSVKRANEKREQERQESLAVESSIAQQQLDWELEAKQLIAESEYYAASCDFDKALTVLDKFSGNPFDFEDLAATREAYENGESSLVAWTDTTKIPFLSFGSLVMDAEKAFTGSAGEDNKYSYISTTEFNAILQQLYDNGFMLVDLYDIFSTTKNEDGTTLIVTNELKLPAGKKPIVLVQCQAGGYTNPLVLTEDGGFTTKVESEDGSSFTGSYDFVPLLEEFIAGHPGFSYKGARAILAVTGSNGLFGHSLEDASTISALVTALTEGGYTLAGNTYGNVSYGRVSVLELMDDINKWGTSVTPLLGDTEVLVYARSSDISDSKEAYSGTKYEKLFAAGFRYYLGICYNSTPWMNISENTIRIGRLMVTGNMLETKGSMFAELFDAAAVLDPNR